MTKNTTQLFRFSCLILILFVSLSCKNKNLIQRGDSLDVAFKKAMGLYQGKEYSEAAQAFETVIQIGRGTDYGQEAQYFLAESYYKDDRYLSAASEYERYISLFPRSEKRQQAQFQEAYCYYMLSPRYKLDQKYTKRAIEKFQLYNSRYPDAQNVEQAAEYITKMRAKLAKKNYYSADLYMRTDQYEAAIIYYDLTIDNFPETEWAQRALVDEINAYNLYASRSVQSKQEERYQKAVDAYEKFVQLFPNGQYRERAEDYVDIARTALADLGDTSQTQTSTASADEQSTGKSE